jgi:hypothetical protein
MVSEGTQQQERGQQPRRATTDHISDGTLDALVNELRTLNGRIEDLVREPGRRQANHNLEAQYGSVDAAARQQLTPSSPGAVTRWQQMTALGAEVLARSAWLLEQYSPANLFEQVATRLRQLEMSGR